MEWMSAVVVAHDSTSALNGGLFKKSGSFARTYQSWLERILKNRNALLLIEMGISNDIVAAQKRDAFLPVYSVGAFQPAATPRNVKVVYGVRVVAD